MTNLQADVALSVFAIVMANKVGDEVNKFLWLYSQIESTMVKVERCRQFEQIQPESAYKHHAKIFSVVDGSDTGLMRVDELTRSMRSSNDIIETGSV